MYTTDEIVNRLRDRSWSVAGDGCLTPLAAEVA
jgi:hypothetical protein